MKNFNLFTRLLLLCVLWLVGLEGFAQSRYWVGGTGSWSDSQHWSYTSGGPGGASVPSSSNNVFIDKYSFTTPGVISLDGSADVKSFYWTSDAATSGIVGSGTLNIFQNTIFESSASGGWNGSIILQSASSAVAKFPFPLSVNVKFTSSASYKILTNLTTSKTLTAQGDMVDFTMHKVKAAKLDISPKVKSTISSSLLKATMGANNNFQIEYTTKAVTCPGSKDGSAKVTKVTGGNGTYSYVWFDENDVVIAGATTDELKNVKKAIYTVSITDGLGKNDYFTITVDGPLPLLFSKVDVVDVTCNGASTGSIRATINYGTPPYNYSVNNGTTYSTNNPTTGLSAGTYNLVIKDNNGCTYPYAGNPIEIKQAAAINLSVTSTDVSGCFGNTNGTITATAIGGAGTLEYSIDGTNFGTTSTFSGLAAGSYTVIVRSSVDKTCQKTANVTIKQPAKLSATATATPVSGCSATPDGQIAISGATGGSGTYEYSIDGGTNWSNSNLFTGLTAKSYNVLIRDAANPTCVITLNAALQVTAKPALTATVASTNVSCNGSANGTITFTNPQGGGGTYEYSVSGTWGSSASFTNLAPGSYTPQIRDAANPTCVKPFPSIIITQPAALNGSASKVNVAGCYSASNGSITITGSVGGSGQYEYSINGTTWSPTATFTGLGAGTYPVSMRDKLSPTCTKPLGSLTITAPAQITSTFSKVDVTGCAGNNNGSITFSGTVGGSGAYDFSIDNGATWATTPAFTGLTAKSYTLVVRDRATPTCTASIGVANITEPAAMAATVTTTNVTCFGTSTGSITVASPTGGSGTYEYSKDNGATWQSSGSFTSLPAATYQVAIRDAANKTCVKVLGSYSITQAPSLTATVTATNVTGCFGSTNGSINVASPSGGSGSYQYSKDGTTWVATGAFTGLAAGSYPIYIRDVANPTCSVKLGDYTVNQPANISITSVTTVDPKCFGDSNGSITVNATGGTAPLTYSNGGSFQSPNLFSGLASGPYTIVVKDAAGCTKQSDVTLNAAQKIVPTITKTDVTCVGPNTGQISITGVTGGTAPYQYSIYGGSSGTYLPTSSFSALPAGTYNVRVKDANGCESDITPLVVKGAVVLDVTASAVAVKPCNGDKSGAINLTITSGTAPYQYNIGAGNKPLVGTTIGGLGAGNYNLTITDGAGCVKNLGNVAVSEPAPITATATGTNVTGCSTSKNGSIFITAGGGVAPLTYSVDNGVTYVATNNIAGLDAKTYNVKVKDANGCVFDAGSVTITAPNALTIDLNATSITNVKCNGDATGAVTIVANGGTAPLTYAMDAGAFGASSTFSGLVAGSYTIRVKDNGGCTQSAPISITQPNVLQPNLQVFNVSCNGLSDGRILVSPTGGTPAYTVTLTPAAAFASGAFSNLAANSYTVKVVDANSCQVSVVAQINQPTPISITTQTSTNPTCSAAGTVTVSATGGTAPLKYSLMQGASAVATNATGSFTNVSAGTYTVDVTDANNCAKVSSAPMTLTSPSAITITGITAPAISCNGGTSSISFVVGGIVGTPTVAITKSGIAIPAPTVTKVGASYNVTAPNLAGGSYLVSVSDSNDPTCVQTQTIDIVEPSKLLIGTPTVVPPTSGNNGSITVIATGGTAPYTYLLNPGSVTNATGIFSGLGSGSYTLSVTDAKGCTDGPLNVALSNMSVVVTGTDIKCNGAKDGQIKVDITGGATPYTIKVTYPNSTVQTYSSPTASYTIPGLDKGAYSIVVTDNNGTSTTKTVNLSEPTKLTIALQNATATLCSGATSGKIDVASNGGTPAYTISWVGTSGGAPVPGGTLVGQSITNLAPADYVVTVTDNSGCSVSASHTIAANPALNLTVASTNPTCGSATSGTITLTATGGNGTYSYTSDGVTFGNTTGSFTGLTAGTYKVAVKDALGCQSASQDVVLSSPTAINIASVTKTDTKCAIGGTITAIASGGSGDLTYRLLRAGSKVLVTSNKTGLFSDVALGNYLVEVTDGGTCPATWPTTITIASGGGTTKIKVINYTIDNIKCSGDKGKATIVVSGVQGTLSCVFVNRTTGVTLTEGVDYTFKATAGATAGDYTIEVGGFSSGSYNMFISDDNACPQKFPFGISGPTLLKFDSVTKVDPSSNTSADGSITAVVSGGVPPYTYSIEGTATKNGTGVFTGLNPGKYKIVVEDKNHCIVVSSEVELIAKSNLSIDDIITVNPKCHAESNGSIDIYASGGSGTMKYSIDNGATFQADHLFTGLKAGTYDVVVEDALGVRATQKVTLADPDAIVVKVVKVKTPSADGTSDGSIVVIATGGSGFYTYQLIDADTGFEFSNLQTGSVEVNFNKLPSGNYKVIVTDENGCTGEVGPIPLEELSLDVAVTDVKCSTDTFGKLDITIKGGVDPFKLTWQPKGGTVNGPIDVTGRTYSIENLAPGDYVLSVTDATNAVYTKTVTIKSPVAIVAVVKSVTSPICAGSTDGIVELDITGGKPAYTITWLAETPNPSGGTGTVAGSKISGLHPSKYLFTIADANGCKADVSTEIVSYPEILIDKVEPVQPKCNGELGTITVTASGGVGALTYSTTIAGAPVQNTTGVFTNVPDGTYTISVTDTKACVKKSADVTIASPAAIALSVVEVLNQTCTTKGKITVSGTGGTGKLTYTAGPLTNDTGVFDNLDAGKYTVVATDEAGCSKSIDVDVISTATLKIAVQDITNVKCNGASTGKITFKVDGATTGLVVTVNGNTLVPDGAGLYVADNLKAGANTIEAKDDSGCNISELHTLTEPAAVTATVRVTKVPTSPTDNSGNIEVVAKGGSGFYKITCFDKASGASLSNISIGEGVPANFNKLLLGTYTILVEDENGCTYSEDVTIGNIAVVAKGISGSCKDPKGSIEVTITDGAKPYTVTYTKKGDATVLDTKVTDENKVVFTGVDPGDYTVKVVDNSSMEVTADVVVPIYTAPDIKLKSRCFVNGDYYIQIDVPATILDYTVSCTKDDGTAVGTYDKATRRITGLAPNMFYHIKIVDALGCESNVLDVELKEMAELKVKNVGSINPLCHGDKNGSITYEIEGGTAPFTYYLYDGASTELSNGATGSFGSLTVGSYVVRAVDNNGCFVENPVTITEPDALTITLDAVASKTSVWCITNAEGKLVYQIAGGVPSYNLDVKDEAGKYSKSVAVAAAGTETLEPLYGGKYFATLTDKNGCKATLATDITGNTFDVVVDKTPSTCRRFIDPKNAKTMGGVLIINDINGGFGATAQYYFKKGLNFFDEPVTPATGLDAEGYYTYTKGTPVTISGMAGYSYTLNFKVVEDGKTCLLAKSFTVGVKPENDFIAIASPDKTVCINSDVSFTAAFSFAHPELLDDTKTVVAEWLGKNDPKPYGSKDFNNSTLDYLTFKKVMDKANLAELHILKVTSGNLCYDQDTAKVAVYPYANPYFSGPIVKKVQDVGYYVRIPSGSEQKLELKYANPIAHTFTPIWLPGSAEWFTIDENNRNIITISDKFDAQQSLVASIRYKIDDKNVCEEFAPLWINKLSSIVPPNAFTPNGDGFNDTWRIIYDEELLDYPRLEVEVYNRWGILVYHAMPYKNDWNGKHNGKDLPTGTYYYVIKLHRGNLPNISGAVSIIR